MKTNASPNLEYDNDFDRMFRLQEESPGKQRRDVNIHNAKLLCQSEYEILQVALSEISTRLTKLEELSQGYQ